MKKLLTNKLAETLLIGIILLFNAQNWVYKFVPSNAQYKPGTIRLVKRKGIRYQLDLSDYQEWLVYFYCKSDSSDYLLDYLENSEVILDIGANIGQTSFNIIGTQQKKGLNPVVHAFEPYPQTFKKLETNKTLNSGISVKTYNLGLGRKKGMLHMTQHSPLNSGGFRMTDESDNSISVPVISLDEFVSENQLTKIDFIKIDVEGFEVQVLEGALETLKTFRPILVFEYSLENINAQKGTIENMLKQLSGMNYDIRTKENISDQEAILKLDYQTDLICSPLLIV
jgi:FkbM family methyltransferase